MTKPNTMNIQQISKEAMVVFKTIVSKIFQAKKPSNKITVCDLGLTKVVLLELEKMVDHLYIHRCEIIKYSSRDQKPALVLKPFLDGKKFKKEGVRVALKGHGVVIRFIRFPKMKIEDLGSAMKYEAEQYIPFELTDVALDFSVVEESVKSEEGEKMEVMLAVIKRAELEPTLEVFRNLECQLSVVDVDVLSGMAALEYFHPEDFSGHVGLLDIGTEISTLGIVRQGKPRFIRDISYGTYDLRKRLKTRADVSEAQFDLIFEKNEPATKEQTLAITESLSSLIGDIRLSFDYYHDQMQQTKPIEKIFLGGGVSHPAVLETLSAGLQIPVCCMDSFKKLKWAPEVNGELLKTNSALLAVAFGLGIRDE